MDEVKGNSPYRGRYTFPTGPEFTRIYDDSDIKFWGTAANFQSKI